MFRYQIREYVISGDIYTEDELLKFINFYKEKNEENKYLIDDVLYNLMLNFWVQKSIFLWKN